MKCKAAALAAMLAFLLWYIVPKSHRSKSLFEIATSLIVPDAMSIF
jgi:hypothetical protein